MNEFIARNGLIAQNNSVVTGSFAQGQSILASGNYSHAEGYHTTSSGNYSHAEGVGAAAIGAVSHTEGFQTRAIGNYSHAEGSYTKTGTQNAFHAGTDAPISSGVITLDSTYGDVTSIFHSNDLLLFSDVDYDSIYETTIFLIDTVTWDSTNTVITLTDTTVNVSEVDCGALGYINSWAGLGGDKLIPGNTSHAEGDSTIAIGTISHAEGDSTIAVGVASHAEGSITIAVGVASHAEGSTTSARGDASHAEGSYTIASGDYSHAEGLETQATNSGSHAEGYQTVTTGEYSHAEGELTQAMGFSSHAEGYGTISSGSYQHVQGQYNIASSAQSAFIHGNGTDDENRSNLIFASGSQVQITGSLLVTGSNTIIGNQTITGSVTAIAGFIKPGAGSEYLLADGTTTAGGSGGTSLGLVQAFSVGLQNIF